MTKLDAVVVGSGPNGLAAAVTLARGGARTLVVEALATPGGGLRTSELTGPGFLHDECAAVHPLAAASGFLRDLGLSVPWVHSPAPLAHPLPDGALLVHRDLEQTAAGLGGDRVAYRRLLQPLVARWRGLVADALAPPLHVPRAPLAFAAFGVAALQGAAGFARRHFVGPRARALFSGLAAHSILPLSQPPSAAVGVLLGVLAHSVGWPLVRGGSQTLAFLLAAEFQRLGGEIHTGWPIDRLEQLPPARVVLCDTSARQLAKLAGGRLPAWYRRRLATWRHGPGVHKLDLALNAAVPWADAAVAQAATVHLGGSAAAIASAEQAVWEGRLPERPYVLVVQPSLFDASRAPGGKHVLWAYCHVPAGTPPAAATAAILDQVERSAPGFRDTVLATSVRDPRALERHNRNYHGGDITGGVADLVQTLRRPLLHPVPWATPLPGLYLCSAAATPGPGVHFMAGHQAATAALAFLRAGGRLEPPR